MTSNNWFGIPGTSLKACVTESHSQPGVWSYTLLGEHGGLFAEDTIDLSPVAHVTTLTPQQVAKIAFILES